MGSLIVMSRRLAHNVSFTSLVRTNQTSFFPSLIITAATGEKNKTFHLYPCNHFSKTPLPLFHPGSPVTSGRSLTICNNMAGGVPQQLKALEIFCCVAELDLVKPKPAGFELQQTIKL